MPKRRSTTPVLHRNMFLSDFFCSESIRRVENILSGPHSGACCQAMDIFVSGYGKLKIDSDLLSVRLVYEEKIEIWKKYCIAIWEGLIHHMKSKAN